MPVYLDIESRVDERAAAAAARKLIEQFSGVGNTISRDLGKSLAGALAGVDGRAARAQIMELQAEYRRLADVEADAAARMVRSMGQVEVAQKRLNEVTDKYGADSSRAAAANVALADSHARAAKAQRDQVDAMVAAEAAHARLGRSADDAGESLTNLQKLGSNPIVNAVGIGSVAAFGTAMFETGKKAGDFQQQMIRLQSSAGETSSNLKTVSDGILRMAGQVGYGASELATGMYTVEKAGYRGGDGLKVLQSAAELAKAENADLGEVLNGLTTSMNDYNIPVSQAADLASKLNEAVGLAKTNLQGFSGALHNVEPTAMMAHVGIDQVYGDLARLTQSGMSPDQGSQNLAQTIRNFMGPNAQMRDALGKLGLSAHQLQTELGDPSVGLNGVLKQVSDRIRQLGGPDGQVAVSAFYKNIDASNALNTAYQALSPQAKKLADDLKSGAITLRELRTQAVIDPQLRQWITMRSTVDGLSTNLKKLQPDLETVQQLFKETTGGAETLNVLAQLYGNPEEAQKTADAVSQIGSATTDAKGQVKGFADTQKGLNAQMSDATAAFGAAATKLGEDFVPAMTTAAHWATDLAEVLGEHPAIAEAAATAVGLMGGAWLLIKGYNLASTVLTPIGAALDLLYPKLDTVAGSATAAGTAMSGMGPAAQEGAIGVDAAAGEEVLAEGRVATAAGLARSAMALAGPVAIGAAVGLPIARATENSDWFRRAESHNPLAHNPVSEWINRHTPVWLGGDPADSHGDITSHATGGPLRAPGPKGQDSALFWGADGEHVLTADDVDAMGGHGGVYAMRAALHRGDGGPIGRDGSPTSRLYAAADTEPLDEDLKRMERLQAEGNEIQARIADDQKSNDPARQREIPWLEKKLDEIKRELGRVGAKGDSGAGSGGSGSPFMPVKLDDNWLRGGLPGLARNAVGFLEDLVLGPLEVAAFGGVPGAGGKRGASGAAGPFGFGAPGAVPEIGGAAGTPGSPVPVFVTNWGGAGGPGAGMGGGPGGAPGRAAPSGAAGIGGGASAGAVPGTTPGVPGNSSAGTAAVGPGSATTVGPGSATTGDWGLPGGATDSEKWLLSHLAAAGFSAGEIRGILAMNRVESGGSDMGMLGLTQGQAPTRSDKLATFLNQWRHPQGSGYHGPPGKNGRPPGVDANGNVVDSDQFLDWLSGAVEGQAGLAHDWQGNAQPSDYRQRVRYQYNRIRPPVVPSAAPVGSHTAAPAPADSPVSAIGIFPPDLVAEGQRRGWIDANGNIKPGAGQLPLSLGSVHNPMSIAPSALPGANMPFPTVSPAPQYHAKGGPIGTDTVPAWLSPGEEVERVSAVQKYGQSFMDRLNAGQVDPAVRYFGVGGGVPAPQAPAPQAPPAPPPAPPKAPPPPKPPQKALKPGGPGKPPVGKPVVGSIHSGSPLTPGEPEGDQTHKGLETPASNEQWFGEGQPASKGIGFGGGLLGAAEGAASQAAGIAASMGTFGAGGGAASSAMQMLFQLANRTAAYGAQVAGIGVEGLLETFLPADSPLSNFSSTLPGKLLAGVAGVRPPAPDTAGKTRAPLTSHESRGTQGSRAAGGDGGQTFHIAGDLNVHPQNFGDMVKQVSDEASRSAYSSASSQYQFSRTP
ncbi:MAG: phage tail tape measure protein [Corynebacterium sp.]|jgi:TP901 family phage tail tape measure protein|nr:phage tail tape measure protein [Corynebacterium sp.]